MRIAESKINMASSREYMESDREKTETEERWETILNNRMEGDSAASLQDAFRQRLATLRPESMEADFTASSQDLFRQTLSISRTESMEADLTASSQDAFRQRLSISRTESMEADFTASPQDAFRQSLSIMRTESMGASIERVPAVDILLLQEQQQKMEELMNDILNSLFSEGGQESSIDLTKVRADLSEQGALPELNVPEFNVSALSISEFDASEVGEAPDFIRFNFPELKYTRTETTIHSHYEKEDTAFSADGVVKTADGREIDFNLDLAMGREFLEEERFTTEESGTVKLIDPLVINFDGHAPLLSDTKFSFDINIDGKEDEISRLLPGSGFLAFDMDGNGLVDDGSELFGARTGNGFFELAEYDTDNNNWIDENDPVFGKLSIWKMGEDGEDSLESLKEAGIGAIHLESRETMFDLTDDANNLQARVEETGVFLKEEGGAGTIQQVKFTV